MELEGTFDGFNYSIPPPFDTIELENMNIWSELSDIDSASAISRVEVLTSGDESKLTGEEEAVGGNNEEEVGGAVEKILKPRRRDYISDARDRGKYFEEQFQKLTLHFHRTISRTGCEGDLTALFEGKLFNTARSLTPALSCGVSAENDSNNSHNLHSSQVNVDHLNSGEVDDHRYAATMLTQKVSSSAVTDHQYNEKTLTPTNDSDAEMEEGEDGPKRKRKRPEPYEYIKVRWTRDQTFSKFAKSLFRQKAVIEDRTAATVRLSLKYERCSFNDENYSDAYKIILCSRKPMKARPPKLAPKRSQNQTPVSFILPRFSPLMPLHSSPTTSTSELLMQTPTITTVGSSVPGIIVPTSNFSTTDSSMGGILMTALSGDFSGQLISLQLGSTVLEDSTAPSPIMASHTEVLEHPISASKVTDSITSCDSSPARSPVHESDLREYGDFVTLGNGQRSPELKAGATKGVTMDCSTNTEPICSICGNVGVGSDNNERKVFWIRCNDPFCYDMVHASCVGFMITCSSSLKQLPAFYCKTHR
ncbi:unnamed protein product [Orchesella dallaii]|uniref:Zinc finger PHD-type domain-containing protein n=1 Tax=Orchesella dallaii TaxID=48710 RepID=A0ABP1RZI3_9HEXA